jgi:hypothetical protein
MRNDALSDRFRFLLCAQVQVNRAVGLVNAQRIGIGAAYLDPSDYSDEAIDAKIQLAIDALESSLASPRRVARGG